LSERESGKKEGQGALLTLRPGGELRSDKTSETGKRRNLLPFRSGEGGGIKMVRSKALPRRGRTESHMVNYRGKNCGTKKGSLISGGVAQERTQAPTKCHQIRRLWITLCLRGRKRRGGIKKGDSITKRGSSEREGRCHNQQQHEQEEKEEAARRFNSTSESSLKSGEGYRTP